MCCGRRGSSNGRQGSVIPHISRERGIMPACISRQERERRLTRLPLLLPLSFELFQASTISMAALGANVSFTNTNDSLHVCIYCGLSFCFFANARAHFFTCNRRSKCNSCSQDFGDRAALRRHLQVSHEFWCDACTKDFGTYHALVSLLSLMNSIHRDPLLQYQHLHPMMDALRLKGSQIPGARDNYEYAAAHTNDINRLRIGHAPQPRIQPHQPNVLRHSNAPAPALPKKMQKAPVNTPVVNAANESDSQLKANCPLCFEDRSDLSCGSCGHVFCTP